MRILKFHVGIGGVFLVLVLTVWLPASAAFAEAAYDIAWTRQSGTASTDVGYSVSADGMGNAFISGNFAGSAFVSKYDTAGTLLWTHQPGTGLSGGVCANALGNVFISGSGATSKYNTDGTLQWTRYGNGCGSGVAADGSGNVFTSGNANSDVFVNKYDSAGTLLWTRQLGTAYWESTYAASSDGLGNVFVSGGTEGDLGGPNAGSGDAFVCKYDSAGTLQWTRQFGTVDPDYSGGVSADALGNVFLSGNTYGSLGGPSAGGIDAFVAKYDSDGNQIWIHQIGTVYLDAGLDVSADGLGNVYLSGETYGDLGGSNAGGNDAFVSKFDSDGTLLWTIQFGTADDDWAEGVSADALGDVYVSGATYGSMDGPNAGGSDAFIVKLVVPEPATMALLGIGGIGVLVRRRKR